MKSKLVILSGNFPPETGGPAKFVKNFSDWASNEIPQVSVISTHPKKDSLEVHDKVKVELISRNRNSLLRYIKTVKKIRIHADKSTLIIANGCFFEILIASILFRIRYCIKLPGDVVWEHARANGETNLGLLDFQKSRLSLKNSILRFLFILSLKRSQLVIVPSSPMYSVCQDWGIEVNKIELIYNAVNTRHFKPQADAEKRFDIITVSRLIAIKKVNELIILARTFNLSLLIVGDGPLLNELKNENLRFGSPATFYGPSSQKELPKLYNQAKYFVLNSEFEAGTPYSLLEARACGLIAVANGSSGAIDVITDGVDGFLVNDKSGVDLQQGLVKAANLGSKYQDYSMAAVADCAMRFSESSIYRQILESLKKHG